MLLTSRKLLLEEASDILRLQQAAGRKAAFAAGSAPGAGRVPIFLGHFLQGQPRCTPAAICRWRCWRCWCWAPLRLEKIADIHACAAQATLLEPRTTQTGGAAVCVAPNGCASQPRQTVSLALTAVPPSQKPEQCGGGRQVTWRPAARPSPHVCSPRTCTGWETSQQLNQR